MMNIGLKIKTLRKSKEITQEQLSLQLGVSSQAVSKWENNITTPDISILPLIASYFEISMNELFDYKLEEREAEIDSIINESSNYIESESQKGYSILKAALTRYPNNEKLLNALLYFILDTNESISTCLKLLDICTDNDIKYNALRFLAYSYKKKGDIASAEAAIKQIPDMTFTRLTETAFLFDDEKKLMAANKQRQISLENLIQMMYKISEYYQSVGKYSDAAVYIEKALKYIYVENDSCYQGYVEFFNTKLEELRK